MCCLDKSNLGASHLTSVGVHGLCQVYTGNLSNYLRMGGTSCNPLLVLGLLGYFIGLAFFIVGLATPKWLVSMVSGDDSSRGLFQGCTHTGLCFTIIKYSNQEIVVQALMITATVLAFIATVVALAFSIQSCNTTPTHKKTAVASLVLAFMAGLLGFSGSLFYAVGFYSIDNFGIDRYLKTQLSYSFGLSLTASLVMPFSACFVLTGAINMVSASRAPQGQVVSSVQAPMAVLYTGQNAMVAYPYQPNQMGSQPYPTAQMGAQPAQTTQNGTQPYQPTQMYAPPQYPPNQQYVLGQFQPNQQYVLGQFQTNQHYVHGQPLPYQPNQTSMPVNAATTAVSSQRSEEHVETNVHEN